MEEKTSGCEEIQAELEEYKTLLWQLSDEYKENVSAAEQIAASEREKREEIEKKLKNLSPQQESFNKISIDIDINTLGLPACVLDNEGKIETYNNKFKFFIELLSLDIEDISDSIDLIEKINTKTLASELNEYFQSKKNIFQTVFKTINSFKKPVYIIIRIYRNEISNTHLALWLELQPNELKTLQIVKSDTNSNLLKEKVVEKKSESELSKNNTLLLEIQSYAKRYEISAQLLSFINKKINNKSENIVLIREIYNKIEKSFNLKKEAKALLKQIELKEKDFIKRLKKQFPSLTANEQKHCLLIRTGLSYKEIASLMEISVNGVKIARNRLRKKLELNGEQKTSDFIDRI